jgi:hypothetical protein
MKRFYQLVWLVLTLAVIELALKPAVVPELTGPDVVPISQERIESHAYIKTVLPVDWYFECSPSFTFTNVFFSHVKLLPGFIASIIPAKPDQRVMTDYGLLTKNNHLVWLHVPVYLWVRSLIN